MTASRTPGLVGLDIGASGIRAVQLKRHRKTGEYQIVKAASVELPRGVIRNGAVADQKAVVKALKKLWRKGRFSTRKVAFGLADSGVMTRQVDLPWMPAKDFRAALRYQVGDALPVDLATVEIDYHLLGESQRKDDHDQPVDLNRILIVAANRDAVSAEATIVRKARLQPIVADSAAFALIRAACQGRLPQDHETQAIADLGADQLTVVIHQGGQPRFIRTVANLGGETATLAIADRLDVDAVEAERLKREFGLNGPAPIVAPIAESSVFGGTAAAETVSLEGRGLATVEALNPWATTIISEVRNSLDYFQASNPSSPIRSLTLTGRTAELGGLVERVATQIPLPVRVLDPVVGLPTSRRVRKAQVLDSRLAVATGLAMAGA
jgi:type IV pilus assembly protein PilM